MNNSEMQSKIDILENKLSSIEEVNSQKIKIINLENQLEKTSLQQVVTQLQLQLNKLSKRVDALEISNMINITEKANKQAHGSSHDAKKQLVDIWNQIVILEENNTELKNMLSIVKTVREILKSIDLRHKKYKNLKNDYDRLNTWLQKKEQRIKRLKN